MVSKQAVYKQISNEHSQLAPFICLQGKRTLIKAEALKALYEVDLENSTLSTQNSTLSTHAGLNIQPNSTQNSTLSTDDIQPCQPNIQPNADEYIAFLKAEIADLKDKQQEQDNRHAAALAEKDKIIQEQTKQLADLCKQVSDIAQKALAATTQQQYLMAYDRKSAERVLSDEAQPEQNNHSLFARLKALFKT